eukprot:5242906-Pyramimonas_sp.AAC.1
MERSPGGSCQSFPRAAPPPARPWELRAVPGRAGRARARAISEESDPGPALIQSRFWPRQVVPTLPDGLRRRRRRMLSPRSYC